MISSNGYGTFRRPTEGDRLGGTLAEGRLAQTTNAVQRTGIPGSSTPLPPSLRVPPVREENNTQAKASKRPGSVVKGMETLHLDHRVWLNSLRFYREELFIFQKHLEQFVRTAAVNETMAHVEQFQNKFLRQSEVIDELAHEIKQHDQALGASVGDGASIVYRPFGVHNELRERMDVFERLYMDLKHEFRRWLAFNR